MRSHAKAATAGSTKRLGKKSKPALLLCVLAAAVASLALVVGSASGATTRFLVEVFGSSAQPTFPGDRGMAVDQATGELYVLETNTDEIRRYNANGTPSNFGALGSNAIDGEGTGDETPDLGLAIAGSRSESQIAIDESGGATDGNIYVTESARDQVSIFSSEGEYLGELSEYETGVFNEPLGVAVDPSGNVYVGDFSSADLIHKYEPAANPPVNADNSASFATLAGTSSPGTLAAGAGATAGFIFVNRFNGELFKLDSSTGELKYQLTTSASTVWVDPESGHVFVPRLTGSNSEVVEFDASGGAEATKVSAFKPGSTVEGVATDNSAEQVYVSRSGTENVEVFGPAAIVPDVVTSPPSSNTGVRATLAGTVNPDGVELDECFFEWGRRANQGGEGIAENTTPCAETPAEIGAGTTPVAVHADIDGLIPQGAGYQFRLTAANPNATINGSQLDFDTPDTVTTEAASGIAPTTATLNGTVNPDGTALSECIFEVGPPKEPGEEIQKYTQSAPCVPGPGGIGAGTSPVAVEADLTELHPGTTYVYRLRAANANGTIIGDALTVQTLGPVAAAWSEDVTATEATLKAEINPEGAATTYRFEYGPSAGYGSETAELAVGSDSSPHTVARFLEGLTPGTTYHYRLVATSGVAENIGPDLTFTTYAPVSLDTDCSNQSFRSGPAAQLPDCRAYEMVSPVDKNNGDIAWLDESLDHVGAALIQSSLDGDKVTYSSYKAFGDAVSAPVTSQYIATRNGGAGWASHAISPPSRGGMVLSPAYVDLEYKAFSPDLSIGWLAAESGLALAPGAAEGYVNLYKRDNTTDTYQALTLGERAQIVNSGYPIEFQGSSADGSHAIFTANEQLTPDAPLLSTEHVTLYEWVDGQLRLVGILPNGEPFMGPSTAGWNLSGTSIKGRRSMVTHAISDDGSRIFWKAQESFGGKIYVRIDGQTTVPVSESVTAGPADFWTASADGSKAVFSVGSFSTSGSTAVLYEFDVDTETPTLIANDVFGVLGASDDASYIYFASKESLDAGATAGERNLYLYHEGTATFIATLSNADTKHPSATTQLPVARNTKVTPDGRHLAFMSQASLTGYDNTDAGTGETVSEVYRYDADADRLSCVSCNPSGARPTGSRGYPEGPFYETELDVAAWIPTWQSQLYSSRTLADDGNRLFFNSFDALVLGDVNGKQDAYQWQAPGTGSCDESSASFSSRNDGCVSLLSSGESPEDSEFLDASASGDDVFIRTKSRLVPQDPGLIDLYDVRVGGGLSSPSEPAPCVGDSCQSPPEAPRDPTPASASFKGAGDPAPRRNCAGAAKRAGKLSRGAKRLRRAAKRSDVPKRVKAMRRRSARFAKQARRLSKSAKRCRRAERRAKR